jgi:hypothetical protein
MNVFEYYKKLPQKIGCLSVVAHEQLMGLITEYDLLQIVEHLKE